MARDNGKIVVTEAWVDDTLDLGARADETKVIILIGTVTVEFDPSFDCVYIICYILMVSVS